MVEDELISRESLTFRDWAITPDEDALIPQSRRREERIDSFRNDLEDDGTVILTHGDADGLTSAALVYSMQSQVASVEPLSYYGSFQFEDALATMLDEGIADRNVYILDFNPDTMEEAEMVDKLINRDNRFTWFDHHQWDNDLYTAFSTRGVRIHLDEEECTASLIGEVFGFDGKLQDLIEVTKDRDLWINEDERSEWLAVYADLAEPMEYIETVLEDGVYFSEEVKKQIDEQMELDERLKEWAVDHAIYRTVQDYSVALTYVSGGVSSEMGNDLVENKDADIAIIMQPYGGASIYSHSDRETFAQCNEVAAELGGGGHPTASGFGFDFDNFLELARYWYTQGMSKERPIIEAIETVVDSDD